MGDGTLTGPRVQVVTGRDPVVRVLQAADGLLTDTGAAICARSVWLAEWLASRPDVEPLVVVVPGPGGPAGLACLAVRRRGLARTLLLAGDGASDYGCLPARDEAAADALADGVLDVIGRLPRPWRLRFAQLPAGDPVAARLAAALRGARVVAGQPCPRLTFGPERELATHTSSARRRAARQGRNQLARDGVDVRVDRVTEAGEVECLLPAMIRMHREHDHGVGRRSDLDDLRRRTFYAAVVARLAGAGLAEMWLLRLNGTIAAYLLGIRDGAVYRLWDARTGVAWLRGKIGRVLDTAVIEELLADPSLAELDWMRGEQRHKLQAATHVVAPEHLLAESSPLVDLADRAASRLRRAARYVLPDSVLGRIRRRVSRASPRTACRTGRSPGTAPATRRTCR